MLMLKRLFIAVVALSLLVSAIGGLAPSSAQGLKPVQDVSVVNTPTVSINGTPTVNVASLPALPFDARPALPETAKQWERIVENDRPNAVVGDPDARAIGLTSITLTNFDTSNTALVIVRRPVLPVSDTCNITNIPSNTIGATGPQTTIFVPAHSTLHLTYPTPLVFSSINGASCILVRLEWFLPGGGVRVALNGFAEY